jgi:hypothetical protein
MKKFLTLLFVIIFTIPLNSAFEDFRTGARPDALGGAFTALSDDHNGSFWNPAGLSNLQRPEVFSTYKRLFGIVHYFTLNTCLPTRWGSFGFHVRETSVKGDYTDASGTVVERNTTLEAERAGVFSHGFHLIREVSFGYNIIVYNLQNVRFGDFYSVGVDMGMLMEVYKRWKIGFSYHNVNSPTFGDLYTHDLPEIISLGVSYSPFKKVTTVCDLEKQFGYDINTKMGVEVEVVEEVLTIRGGVESEPVDFSLGFGTGYKNLRLNYTFRTHAELPLTHSVEAGWEF